MSWRVIKFPEKSENARQSISRMCSLIQTSTNHALSKTRMFMFTAVQRLRNEKGLQV